MGLRLLPPGRPNRLWVALAIIAWLVSAAPSFLVLIIAAGLCSGGPFGAGGLFVALSISFIFAGLAVEPKLWRVVLIILGLAAPPVIAFLTISVVAGC